MTAADPSAGRRARDAITMGRVVLALAGALLALVLLAAVAPGLLAGQSPTATHPVGALHGPSGAHWFGTDQLGRDVYTRIVYGARTALLIGAGATALAVLGGAVLGLASGLAGPLGDQILMRLADVLLALPPLLLALLVVAVLGGGAATVVVAVGVAFIPPYGRLVRAEALVVRRSTYVEAAVGLGLGRGRLIARHVLPNTLGPLLVVATVGFGGALISSSALSFLGLGPRPPRPEWGSMLSEGRDFLSVAWWVGVFPGAVLTVTVIAVNVVGRAVQLRLSGRAAR
ncbi:Dipeptide transport system permease protein DppC [Frankia sp. AiPs1]|uniref:ABC transporter permease n=1 Tax=Frankia sp. AiPa1 TaxID=573492 RepID=UPI00202B5403|nr:ABC transporter permease [Frankia sp. AiPa1]MCL9762478.1 ABC transporter permease [Frankia sp. AiPa1]